MSNRPLPPAVGATENALRALLSLVLAGSPIGGYAEWISLNVVEGSGDVGDLDLRIALVLGQPREVAAAARAQLVAAGLIDPDGGLTALGHEQLRHARAKVAGVTARLTTGIDQGALTTTIETLDTVRSHAERLLARSSLDDYPRSPSPQPRQ